MCNDIIKIRKRIDKIDKVLAKKLIERFRLVKMIGDIKKRNKLKIADKNREREIVNEIVKDVENKKEQKILKKIYSLIFEVSKEQQI